MVTVEDLIKAGKIEVRQNSDLMSAYIKLFQEKFGRKPDCAGCTFDYDWKRLTQSLTSINTENMSSNKTFKLRDNSIIYTFERENEETKTFRRVRVYGNIMTEEFAEEYLTAGTTEEIESRKKRFKILPEKFRETDQQEVPAEVVTEVSVLKAKAIEKGYPEEEFKDIFEEDQMIAYMDGKALESENKNDLIASAEQRMADQREGKNIQSELPQFVLDSAKELATPELTSPEIAPVTVPETIVPAQKDSNKLPGKTKNVTTTNPKEGSK